MKDILTPIEREIRESNKKIHALNANPSQGGYDENFKKIRKELNDKILQVIEKELGI